MIDEILADESFTITLENKEGKKSIIDFNGDSVKYLGDLSVEESAKIFFDCVFDYYKEHRDGSKIE